MINELFSELEKSENPVLRVLYKEGTTKVIAIIMKKGMILKGHKTNIPSKLVVIKGNVLYREESKVIALEGLEEVVIPVGILHSLEAQEDSLCLLLQS